MFSRSRWMEVALSLSQQMQMMEKYLAKLTLTPTTYTLLEYLLLHIYIVCSSCLSQKITISITYSRKKCFGILPTYSIFENFRVYHETMYGFILFLFN